MLKKTIFPLFSLILAVAFTMSTFAKNPGDKADDFTLDNWDGTKYNLNETVAKSKAIVIMFWSTECPNVQPYNDRIGEFAKEYSGKGFTFWAINSNNTESLDDVSAHAKKNDYPFPVLKDKNNVIADMLGATKTPEVYVIGKDNIILYHGRISNNRNKSEETSFDLKNALDEISADKEVTLKETKSFGCTIKRIN